MIARSLSTVVGETVYLRPIELEDIDRGWLGWVNDPEIEQNLGSSGTVSREELERYYESSQPPAVAMFAICRVRRPRGQPGTASRRERGEWHSGAPRPTLRIVGCQLSVQCSEEPE